jgi:hypothetical protein
MHFALLKGTKHTFESQLPASAKLPNLDCQVKSARAAMEAIQVPRNTSLIPTYRGRNAIRFWSKFRPCAFSHVLASKRMVGGALWKGDLMILNLEC